MPTPSWRFGASLLVAGVLAGLVAAGLTELLHAVQHLAFGYDSGPFAVGVQRAPGWRRVAALGSCGVVAGVGWYLLRRHLPDPVRVRVAVRDRIRMRPESTIVESLLQIVTVGLGASLGRESAPRRMSGALAQWLADGVHLDRDQTRVVIACAAGAGFGAVYNVPLAGTLFVAEILLRTRRAATVLTAALVCVVATAVAWISVPWEPFYAVSVRGASGWLLLGALLAGPVAAAAGLGFERVTTFAGAHRARGWRIPVTAVPVFTLLGVVGIAAPELLGNGRGPATLAFDVSDHAVWLLLVLAVAKPLVTAACLGTGVSGGLVTPALATGALLGAGLGAGWTDLVGTSDTAAYSVLVAAGVLVVTMRAPFTALAFAWEVTGVPVWFLVPLAVTAAGAWICSRGWARPPG
ncbi:chloride channel protein [Jatrophihabitans sp. YIM 134969]